MKVLFYYRESESLGIGYMSSMLKAHGHEVELLYDFGVSAKYGMADFSLFGKEKINDELLHRAHQFQPDIVAFSADLYIYPYVREWAARVKQHFPKVPTICGGIQTSSLPHVVLADPNIDMLCIGEGEYAFQELCDRMGRGEDYFDTKNMWFKKGDDIVKNPLRPLVQNLDDLPFPDRDLFYKYGAFKNHLMLMGSRGCPYRCTFCHNPHDQDIYKGKSYYEVTTPGKLYRRRTVDNVIAEIKHFRAKYPLKGIEFEDEIFTVSKSWVKEFRDKYTAEVGLPYWCEIKANTIDEDTAQWLKESGCAEIFMGFESGDDYVRNVIMDKRLERKQLYRAAKVIKDAGIRLQCTAMFGLPEETPEQMWRTIETLEDLKPESIPTYTFFPFPGTPLLEKCKKDGILDEVAYKAIEYGQKGLGQTHARSIIKHPYANMAYNISKLASFYVWGPKILKPLLKKVMLSNRRTGFVDLVYTAMLPINYPFYGRERIMMFLEYIFKPSNWFSNAKPDIKSDFRGTSDKPADQTFYYDPSKYAVFSRLSMGLNKLLSPIHALFGRNGKQISAEPTAASRQTASRIARLANVREGGRPVDETTVSKTGCSSGMPVSSASVAVAPAVKPGHVRKVVGVGAAQGEALIFAVYKKNEGWVHELHDQDFEFQCGHCDDWNLMIYEYAHEQMKCGGCDETICQLK